MDLIKTQNKSKNSIVLDLIRILFDVVFVAGILAAIIWLRQPIVAVVLVLLSKWRVLFVRLRFWWVNILANLTDVIFGLGMVVLICITGGLEVQLGLGAAYLLWNILLKPGSRRPYILIQAAISQFVGLWAVFALAQWLALPIVMALAAIVGFVTARHILMDYEDEDSRLVLAWSWGAVLAGVAFLAFHWTLAYNFFGLILVPQVSVLTLLLGLITWAVYDSYMKHKGQIQWNEIRWPVLFSGLLILIVTVIFGGLF